MKILMICEFFDDALDYQENMLARAYSKLGHDVSVIASTIESIEDYVADLDRGKGQYSQQSYEWGRLYRVPFSFNLLNRIKRFAPLTELITTIGPDLLFFHDIIPNLNEGVRYVAQHPSCAMIMDYHADVTNSGANWLSRQVLHGIIRRRILNGARPHLRKIFPVTPGSTEFLSTLYGVPEHEMELLPLGTDQEYARCIMEGNARQRIRGALNIPIDTLTVFTGGKFTPLKQTEEVIHAFHMHPDLPIRAIIIGGSDRAYPEYGLRIQELARSDDRLHFVGWQDREGVYSHMAASDLAIFPASQSVLWQQSLGMGLPLIVSEQSQQIRGTTSVRYLDRHANLQILDSARPFAEQIGEQLHKLVSDRALLARMSQGALKTAAEMLDYKAIAERTLACTYLPHW
ncbi:glycosyltransferase family 4 protein [Altererythrobacter arenosus]|uniref:Glycosyltransferase family 4 protein n=1 Tax=Altererythrobacter arenosus TaxID=3032592 RepID=A0ABY8FVF6_9SPHN|nr:glycosyltransferase family 4 protein [Altererythrobacter sp. CAU 1644]WFL78712.1 glycosyltransferase family 4 protein [Altererythrobacter sp. CAU 1644]